MPPPPTWPDQPRHHGPADYRPGCENFLYVFKAARKRAARAADRARGLRSAAAPLRHAPTPVGWRATQATVRAAESSTSARRRTGHTGRLPPAPRAVGPWARWTHAGPAGRVAVGAGLRSWCLRRGPPAPGWPKITSGVRWVGGCARCRPRLPSTRSKLEPEPGPRSRSYVRGALHLEPGPGPGSP